MSFESLDRTNEVMAVIAKRQQALTSNIVNMQTPGYLRQDVNFEQYLQGTVSPLETSLSKKLGPSPLTEVYGEKISPNQEFLLMQKNLLFYTLATKRATSIIQEIKTVSQAGR